MSKKKYVLKEKQSTREHKRKKKKQEREHERKKEKQDRELTRKEWETLAHLKKQLQESKGKDDNDSMYPDESNDHPLYKNTDNLY